MELPVVAARVGFRYAAEALRRFTLSVIAIALLSGCGQTSARSVSTTPVAHVQATVTPQATSGPSARLSMPAFQGGVIVYADGNDPALLSDAQRLLDHLVSIRVNSVALAFPLYQTSWTSTDVHADPAKTPSDAFIQGFISAARERGLAVLLRPLIDDTPLMKAGHWRGQLQPTDAGAWFASYKASMLRYAAIAQADGAAVLDIGTELSSMQTNTAAWNDMIGAIRTVYNGELTYSSNWDAAYPAFGSALDFASVDAFYPQIGRAHV